jgi:hypothetical protein
LVESGNAMGAQKLILKELTREFGGSAKAAGDTLGGQLSKLRERPEPVRRPRRAAHRADDGRGKGQPVRGRHPEARTTANNFKQSLQLLGRARVRRRHTGEVVGRFKLFKIAAADAGRDEGLAFANQQFSDETTAAITSTVTFTSALDALKACRRRQKPLRDLRKAAASSSLKAST